jgi:hypothetical protein
MDISYSNHNNLQGTFYSGCTNLHFHQHVRGFQYRHILTNSYNFPFSYYSNLSMCEVVSYSGLNWISLMRKYIEHIFVYLLAICISSLEKCLFKSLLILLDFFKLSCLFLYCNISLWVQNTWPHFFPFDVLSLLLIVSDDAHSLMF